MTGEQMVTAPVSAGGSLLWKILCPVGIFWSIAFWILLIVIVHASIASYQQKSTQPFVDEVVSRLVSADGALLQESIKMKTEPAYTPKNFLDSIRYVFSIIFRWLNVFSLVYFIFINFFIIYKLMESTMPFGVVWSYSLWTIVIMTLMENVWTAFYLHTLSFPFVGLISFVLVIVGIANPIYSNLYHVVVNQTNMLTDMPPAITNATIG